MNFDILVPHKTPWWLKSLFPRSLEWTLKENISSQDALQKKPLCLTFDDGPIPEATPQVLDLLDKHQCKAVFFVVGDNVRKYPEIYRELIARGHQVGNHTFHHVKGRQHSPQAYLDEIELCEQAMEKALPGSSHLKLFRPPYGSIKREQIQLLERKYRIIMWDVLTHDYNAKLPTNALLKRSQQATKNGSIVVFHDSLKSLPHFPYLLEEYVCSCKDKGYEFVGI